MSTILNIELKLRISISQNEIELVFNHFYIISLIKFNSVKSSSSVVPIKKSKQCTKKEEYASISARRVNNLTIRKNVEFC